MYYIKVFEFIPRLRVFPLGNFVFDREEANRKYLKSKVDVHLNKLIIELLKGKPEDVVGFINNWAGNEIGGVSEVKTEVIY